MKPEAGSTVPRLVLSIFNKKDPHILVHCGPSPPQEVRLTLGRLGAGADALVHAVDLFSLHTDIL